jgi:hypothetical protein
VASPATYAGCLIIIICAETSAGKFLNGRLGLENIIYFDNPNPERRAAAQVKIAIKITTQFFLDHAQEYSDEKIITDIRPIKKRRIDSTTNSKDSPPLENTVDIKIMDTNMCMAI